MRYLKEEDNKQKISIKEIIIIITYLLSSLNILLSIYNGYIEQKEEEQTCSCSVFVNVQ